MFFNHVRIAPFLSRDNYIKGQSVDSEFIIARRSKNRTRITVFNLSVFICCRLNRWSPSWFPCGYCCWSPSWFPCGYSVGLVGSLGGTAVGLQVGSFVGTAFVGIKVGFFVGVKVGETVFNRLPFKFKSFNLGR
jgi:hypothetical protein